MKLVTYGLHSTMEYYVATLLVSSLIGRAVVLSYCTENRVADWFSNLLHSKFIDFPLFRVYPLSSYP